MQPSHACRFDAARPGCWHTFYNIRVSNSHLIDQLVFLIDCPFVGWHHIIGAKPYNLRQSGQMGGQNSMNKTGSGPDWQSPVFCTFLTAVMMQIALTGRVLRPIPRYSELIGKQLFKERSNETHLSAKRIGTQTSPWIPLSDVNRWRSPGLAGTPCKGSCAPFCLDADPPVEGYLNGV